MSELTEILLNNANVNTVLTVFLFVQVSRLDKKLAIMQVIFDRLPRNQNQD